MSQQSLVAKVVVVVFAIVVVAPAVQTVFVVTGAAEFPWDLSVLEAESHGILAGLGSLVAAVVVDVFVVVAAVPVAGI